MLAPDGLVRGSTATAWICRWDKQSRRVCGSRSDPSPDGGPLFHGAAQGRLEMLDDIKREAWIAI